MIVEGSVSRSISDRSGVGLMSGAFRARSYDCHDLLDRARPLPARQLADELLDRLESSANRTSPGTRSAARLRAVPVGQQPTAAGYPVHEPAVHAHAGRGAPVTRRSVRCRWRWMSGKAAGGLFAAAVRHLLGQLLDDGDGVVPVARRPQGDRRRESGSAVACCGAFGDDG